MRNKEEELLSEIHEMRNLMEYMDSEVITEAVSNQELRQTAKQQARDTDTSGIENVREKEVIAALQQLIGKIKDTGNQYSPMVKKYTEKLWGAVNNGGGDEVNENEVIDESIADDIAIEYNIEDLINKIAKDKKQHPSTVAIILSRIADKINAKRKRPEDYNK